METTQEKTKPNFKDVYQYKDGYVYEIHNIAGQAKDILCIRPNGSGEPFFFSQTGEKIEAERIVYNEKIHIQRWMPLELYKEKHGEFWLEPDSGEEEMEHLVDKPAVSEVIENRFGPSVKLPEDAVLKTSSISELAKGLATYVYDNCPDSPEKDNAINFLQLAKMSAVASIASKARKESSVH